MKTSVLSLTLAAVLTASVPALAQDSAPADNTEQPAKPKTDKKRIFKSGAIGCAAGGALAFLTGKKDKALAACAVGAVVGSVASYKKQLDEARALQQEAQAAGIPATVTTKQVQAKSGEQVEALDAITLPYNPASMTARDPETVRVLDKIAALAKKSKEPLSIESHGKNEKACQIPLAELSARGSFPPAKAVDKCGQGKSQIVITPVPDLT